jgi:hypothetical protein
MVVLNDFARFMWVHVNGFPPHHHEIFIGFFYFPPISLDFSILNGLDKDPS